MSILLRTYSFWEQPKPEPIKPIPKERRQNDAPCCPQVGVFCDYHTAKYRWAEQAQQAKSWTA